ncbi:glycosyltransferase family 2 protein [Flavobacterium franklandianum]|uniref:Glycosyltransferase family 2 protein n=1 Tax=Flavobacterium franklandianum TaxID=2594430 RepID=A0A553CKA7_9FLAO|nr:glycosyltransferase family A protein [Flavobacterium franklandianum]TRX20917.1 glycosyltransferase family 2 protein [Flavobacterium franklandianum]TRX23141.1 glycosyltransferase family 2 protein [Flavobacterium franklandianum]
MKSFVSIVVPCYNQAQFLDEALQCIYNQTHTNWECIIVNDGSSDHTEAVANGWVAKDARFVYVYKNNGGVSRARNCGIEHAKAEFILTLDADDKYEATFLEKALAVLVNNAEIGIVSSWGRRYLTNGKPLQEFKSKAHSVSDFLFGNGLHMGSSLFRRECWEKSGGYDTDPRNGYEDWEFYLGVCKLGWKVKIIEEFLFFYRQHLVSRRTTMNRQYKDNMAFIYTKHKDLYLPHYEDMVNHFLDSIVSEKREYLKVKNKLEFKIGTAILRPLRFVKKLMR